MTPKEHQLVILMLAKQLNAYRTLLRTLAEKGLIDPARASELEDLRSDIGVTNEGLHLTRLEYLATALSIGLEIPTDEEQPTSKIRPQ